MIDVLVIGLGPAGGCAAAAAARAGARVLAIDRRARAGVPVQCAELVPAALAAEVPLAAAAVQPVDRMRTWIAGALQATDALPGWMLDRARFDAGLVAAARAAGADCRLGVAARTIDAAGRVTLSTGETIAPRAIVGADGARSAVGRAIGAANTDFVITRQVTVPLPAAATDADIVLDAALPGGYGWVFPRGRRAHVGAGAAAAARGVLKPWLARLRMRLAAAGRIAADAGALAGSSLTGGAIPAGGPVGPTGRLGGVAVLLAGDAAGLANPVTGAGIAAAVISGRMAGRAAALGDHAGYRDELAELFAASLARASRRRAALLAQHGRGVPDAAALRLAWIAAPEYWAA